MKQKGSRLMSYTASSIVMFASPQVLQSIPWSLYWQAKESSVKIPPPTPWTAPATALKVSKVFSQTGLSTTSISTSRPMNGGAALLTSGLWKLTPQNFGTCENESVHASEVKKAAAATKKQEGSEY
jgi:hypothetical protein